MTQRPFRRLAIVNRGEAAMRAIRAVRELNWERDEPIRIIALHIEAERHALFVRQADERHCLGEGGYLDYDELERALTETRADAAWVGWGFVAEHPEFAELCERLGIVFVGPDADVMRALGDKVEGKRLAEKADVPVAAWSGGAVESIEEAKGHADTIGFPLMIKAAAGGGGRGMRRVDNADELENAFDRAREEAKQAFGDSRVLMEKVVGSARHVEVQLMADGQGAVWALGVRDCTYQRRHQKVVEESASPALTPEQEREVADSAVELARLAGYRGAGTVEFLYEPNERRFSFMEVNTRLQVEHPVTEMVTGADLVKLQLHVAAGGRLEGDPPPPSGHAIEARLNAEDPGLGFAPTPGRISLLRLPGGPGVRVDSGVAEGDVVPPQFDSMIAKIIAHGSTREEAIARLRRAIADTMVVIDDGATNQGFLLELLGRDELRTGDVDTGWLDRLHGQGAVQTMRHADVALVRAAIELCDDATAKERSRFYAFARRGRPEASAEVCRNVDLRYRGTGYRFAVSQVGPQRYLLEVDGTRIEAELEQVSEHEQLIRYGGGSYRTLTALQDADLLVEVDGVPHRVSRDEGGLIRCPSPGVVVAIPVSPGDEVNAGDVLAVTESMKMESSLTAPVRGRVREVLVSTNTHVPAGRPLVQIEPLEDGQDAAEGDRLQFANPADRRPRPPDPAGNGEPPLLDRLQWLVLGYDVPPREAQAHPRQRAGRAGRSGRRVAPAGGVRRPSRGQPAPRRRQRCGRRRAQPAALPAGVPEVARPERGGPARPVRGEPGARASPLRHRWSGAHRGARGRQLPAVLGAPARGHRQRVRARDPRASPGRRRRPGRLRRRVPRGAGPARSGARHHGARAGRAGPRGALAPVRPPADRAGARGRTTRSSTSTSTRWPRIRPAPIARRMRERSSSARSRWRRWCSAESATLGPTCAGSCSRR